MNQCLRAPLYATIWAINFGLVNKMYHLFKLVGLQRSPNIPKKVEANGAAMRCTMTFLWVFDASLMTIEAYLTNTYQGK